MLGEDDRRSRCTFPRRTQRRLPYALEPEGNVKSRMCKQNDRLWREVGIVIVPWPCHSLSSYNFKTNGMIEEGGTYERCRHRRHEISAAETRGRHEHSSGPDGVRMAVKHRVIHTSELLPERLLPGEAPPKSTPLGNAPPKSKPFRKMLLPNEAHELKIIS